MIEVRVDPGGSGPWLGRPSKVIATSSGALGCGALTFAARGDASGVLSWTSLGRTSLPAHAAIPHVAVRAAIQEYRLETHALRKRFSLNLLQAVAARPCFVVCIPSSS